MIKTPQYIYIYMNIRILLANIYCTFTSLMKFPLGLVWLGASHRHRSASVHFFETNSWVKSYVFMVPLGLVRGISDGNTDILW